MTSEQVNTTQKGLVDFHTSRAGLRQLPTAGYYARILLFSPGRCAHPRLLKNPGGPFTAFTAFAIRLSNSTSTFDNSTIAEQNAKSRTIIL